MDEAGGLIVIDGSHLRSVDPSPPAIDGPIIGDRIIQIAESLASNALLGLSLPNSIRSAVLDRMGMTGSDAAFESTEFGKEDATKEVGSYLSALADQLKDEPIVVSVLDGNALRIFLDDEDDFAMLAENLFTELDVLDTGKLKKNEIRNALDHMGVDMGVPPFSVSKDLLNSILKKHRTEGEEELGQAQFAQLLQPVLQDLADALTKNHVTVLQNIKIVNGSKIRKVLDDETALHQLVEIMYHDWISFEVEKKNIDRLRNFIQSKAEPLGLPPQDTNELKLIYNQIFLGLSEEKIHGELIKDTFQEVVMYVLERFAEQLNATPVYVVQS